MAKSNYGSDIKRKMKRDRNKRIIRTLVEVVLVLLASAAVAFLFFSSVMIQENSMSPTLMAGDRVFINRVVYAIGSVHRGDLIAYRGSGGTDSGIHVKRVIALPGETIQIRDGLILIDGKTYIENREFPNITKPGIAAEGIRLGSEEYFVLGDFDSYVKAWENMDQIYNDKERWARMSLANIANSAFFSSDRTIAEYAKDIWNI